MLSLKPKTASKQLAIITITKTWNNLVNDGIEIMDKQQFSICGDKEDLLLSAIQIAFSTGYGKAAGWLVDLKNGLVILSYEDKNAQLFPSRLDAAELLPIVVSWLKSDQAIKLRKESETYEDGDGDNTDGWHCFCGPYGSIGDERHAICAIKPVYIYYSK